MIFNPWLIIILLLFLIVISWLLLKKTIDASDSAEREKWVRVCPKCKSKEVSQRGMISEKAYSNNFVCLSCGFQGPLFPEMSPSEAQKLADKPRNFIQSRLPIFADGSKKYDLRTLAALLGFGIMLFLLWLLLHK